MKHLYIIGNGFDIFTGLKTSYRDFKVWLKDNYAFVYEALDSVYGENSDEWWGNFEVSLGKLDITQYVKKFFPPEKPIKQILEEIEEKRKQKKNTLNIPPSFSSESPCAKRLSGLFDILHYCLKKWILSMKSIRDVKYIHLEKDDSLFLSFNYTRTLEWLYGISKDKILHIHGDAYDDVKLIFGHNSSHVGYNYPNDGDKVCSVLDRYHKNPYEYIFKHDDFFDKIKDVDFVHIYGLSFSPVDLDYIDCVYKLVTNANWEISWYSENDKKRIDSFVLSHWGIKDKLRLIRLDSIVDKIDDKPTENILIYNGKMKENGI